MNCSKMPSGFGYIHNGMQFRIGLVSKITGPANKSILIRDWMTAVSWFSCISANCLISVNLIVESFGQLYNLYHTCLRTDWKALIYIYLECATKLPLELASKSTLPNYILHEMAFEKSVLCNSQCVWIHVYLPNHWWLVPWHNASYRTNHIALRNSLASFFINNLGNLIHGAWFQLTSHTIWINGLVSEITSFWSFLDFCRYDTKELYQL